jgi:GT2 family glycosyltransferase
MLDTVAQDIDIGIVGGLFYYPNSDIVQHGGGTIFNFEPDGKFDVEHLNHRVKITEAEDLYRQRDCIFVTFALTLITRSCLERIGYLDERLTMAFNDVEYCIRAWEHGLRVVYQPKCQATHEEGRSIRWACGVDYWTPAWNVLKGRWSIDHLNDLLFKVELSNFLHPMKAEKNNKVRQVKKPIQEISIEKEQKKRISWFKEFRYPAC